MLQLVATLESMWANNVVQVNLFQNSEGLWGTKKNMYQGVKVITIPLVYKSLNHMPFFLQDIEYFNKVI